jgi:hypothetical protein
MAYGYVTPAGGFTLEIWFKRTGTATGSQALFSQQTQNKSSATNATPAVNGRQLLVYLITTGEVWVDWRKEDGTQLVLYQGTNTYGADGEWHHLALKISASDLRTWKLFVDGAVETSGTLSAAIDWKPGTLTIGAAYAPYLGNFGDYLYSGSLGYAAVWDTEQFDARIIEHYTAGNGGTVYYGDDEVKRLGRIFDFCKVPTNARRFDDPITTLQGIQIAGENGLAKALETATDATGLVFADGQAIMTYHNRRHRYNRAILKTLSEENVSAPDIGMEFATDDTKVYNDVRASRPYGGSARIRNKSSEYEYGRRVYELKLAVTSDDEMRNAGTWLANRYGEDRVRISGVTLSAESSDEIEELVGTIQIGDCIAFDDLPDNAPFTYAEFIVEGISVQASFKDQTWSLGLELSPAELWNVLQVGVSTLGDGSRIAY